MLERVRSTIMRTATRADLAALAGTIVLAAVFFWAILANSLEYIGGDQYRWVALIDEWMKGEFRLESLFKPHGGHRATGYKFVFLLNAEIFHLNFTVEKILAASALVGVFYIVLRHLRAVEFLPAPPGGDSRIQRAMTALVFVAAAFLILNPTSLTTVATYSVITMRVFNFAGFLLIFWLVSRHLTGRLDRAGLVLLVLMLALFSNFFGRAWGMSMMMSVMLVLVAGTVARRFDTGRFDIRVSDILLFAYTGLLLAVYILSVSENVRTESSFSLVDLVRYVAILMSRSFTLEFGHTDLWAREPKASHYILGLSILALYGLATLAFFGLRMYRKSWVPILLMSYGVGSSAMVYVGRALKIADAERVLQSAFFPRFIYDCSVGHVGLLVVLAAALLHLVPGPVMARPDRARHAGGACSCHRPGQSRPFRYPGADDAAFCPGHEYAVLRSRNRFLRPGRSPAGALSPRGAVPALAGDRPPL